MAFARKVYVTMFILMKTIIFISRGRYEGIANVESYRDIQGQTGTDRDGQGQTGTDKDKEGQAWTNRDRHGQVGTSRDRKGMSLLVPVCPGHIPVCPCLFLLVPGLSEALTSIIGKYPYIPLELANNYFKQNQLDQGTWLCQTNLDNFMDDLGPYGTNLYQFRTFFFLGPFFPPPPHL